MNDCLFCKIIAGEIPSTKVFEDDQILAFRDINPMAPTHILVIPKQHISGVDEITPENSAVVAHIFEMIAVIAKEEGLTNGYRVVSNSVRTAVRRCATCTSTFSAARSFRSRWRNGEAGIRADR